MEQPRKYTQREWDREVGWGEVPEEYAYDNSELEKVYDKDMQHEKDAYDEAMKGL